MGLNADTIAVEVGKRIGETIRQKGISNRECAEVAGMTEVSLSRYVMGARMPNALALYNLAKALGVSMEFLLTGKQ